MKSQCEMENAAESSRIAAIRESTGIDGPNDISIKVQMPQIRATPDRTAIHLSSLLNVLRFVEAVISAGLMLVVLVGVAFNQIDLALAMLITAILLIVTAKETPTEAFTQTGTPDIQDRSMGAEPITAAPSRQP